MTAEIGPLVAELTQMAEDSDASLPGRFLEVRHKLIGTVPAKELDDLTEAINSYEFDTAAVILKDVNVGKD